MAVDYLAIIGLIQAFLEFLKAIDVMIFTEITLNTIWAFVTLSLAGSAVNGLDHFRDGLTKNEVVLIIQGAIIAVFLAIIFFSTGLIEAYYMTVVGFIAPFIWVRLVQKFTGFFSTDGESVSQGQQAVQNTAVPSTDNPSANPVSSTIEEIPQPALNPKLSEALKKAGAEA